MILAFRAEPAETSQLSPPRSPRVDKQSKLRPRAIVARSLLKTVTRGSGPDQFHTDSTLNRVAHKGYVDKEVDCGTRQIFGAFRRQTV